MSLKSHPLDNELVEYMEFCDENNLAWKIHNHDEFEVFENNLCMVTVSSKNDLSMSTGVKDSQPNVAFHKAIEAHLFVEI